MVVDAGQGTQVPHGLVVHGAKLFVTRHVGVPGFHDAVGGEEVDDGVDVGLHHALAVHGGEFAYGLPVLDFLDARFECLHPVSSC